MQDIVVKIKGDISNFKAALDRAAVQTKTFQQKVESIAGGMQKAGLAMTAFAGGVAASLALATREFVNYEDALATVRKTTGLAGEELKKLDEGIRELSKSMPLAQKELAEIAAVAGQLGIQGVDNIIKFTETAAKVATAFDMTAEEAATAMAKLANIYKIPIEEVDRLASAINALGNTTAATEAEILRAMYQVGAAGIQFGLTAQQVAAMTDTLIAMGMAPERAGTRLQSALNLMSKNIDKFAELLGEDVEDLKNKFEKDFYGTLISSLEKLQKIYTDNEEFIKKQTQQIENLAKGFGLSKDLVNELYTEFLNLKAQGLNVDTIKDKFSEMAEELGITKSQARKLVGAFDDIASESAGMISLMVALNDIFGQVGSKAIVALASNSEALEKALNTANKAFEENISLQEEYANKTDTLKARLQVLKNQFVDVALTIGEALKPALEELINGIKEYMPSIKQFAKTFTENLIPAFRPIFSALKKLLDWFNNLPEATKETVAKFLVLATAISAVAGPILLLAGTALPALVAALTALLSPLGLVAGAFGVLSVAIATNFGGIRDKLVLFVDNIKKKLFLFISWVKNIMIPEIQKRFAPITEFFSQLWEKVSEFLVNAFSNIAKTFNEIKINITPVLKDIYDSFIKIFGKIKSGLEPIFMHIEKIVNFLKEKIGSVFTYLINLDWDVFVKSIKTKFNEMLNFIKNSFGLDITNEVKKIFNNAKTAIANILKNISFDELNQKANDVLKKIKDSFSELIDDIKPYLSKFKNNAVESLKGLKFAIAPVVNSIISKLGEIWTELTKEGEAIDKWIEMIKEDFKIKQEKIVEHLEKIKQAFDRVLTYLPGAAETIVGAFKWLFDKILSLFDGYQIKVDISKYFEPFLIKLPDLFDFWLNLTLGTVESFLNRLADVLKFIDELPEKINKIKQEIPKGLQALKQSILNILSFTAIDEGMTVLKTFVDGLTDLSVVKEKINTLVSNIKSIFDIDTYKKGAKLITDFIAAMSNLEASKQLISDLKSKIESIFEIDLYQKGVEAIQSFFDGLKSLGSTIRDWFLNLFEIDVSKTPTPSPKTPTPSPKTPTPSPKTPTPSPKTPTVEDEEDEVPITYPDKIIDISDKRKREYWRKKQEPTPTEIKRILSTRYGEYGQIAANAFVESYSASFDKNVLVDVAKDVENEYIETFDDVANKSIQTFATKINENIEYLNVEKIIDYFDSTFDRVVEIAKTTADTVKNYLELDLSNFGYEAASSFIDSLEMSLSSIDFSNLIGEIDLSAYANIATTTVPTQINIGDIIVNSNVSDVFEVANEVAESVVDAITNAFWW